MKLPSLRRTVLWLTGRDLLEPPLPPLPQGVYYMLQGPPEARWVVAFTPDGYMKFNLPEGPNVLHRIAQRVVFGIRWHMLPEADEE